MAIAQPIKAGVRYGAALSPWFRSISRSGIGYLQSDFLFRLLLLLYSLNLRQKQNAYIK